MYSPHLTKYGLGPIQSLNDVNPIFYMLFVLCFRVSFISLVNLLWSPLMLLYDVFGPRIETSVFPCKSLPIGALGSFNLNCFSLSLISLEHNFFYKVMGKYVGSWTSDVKRTRNVFNNPVVCILCLITILFKLIVLVIVNNSQ